MSTFLILTPLVCVVTFATLVWLVRIPHTVGRAVGFEMTAFGLHLTTATVGATFVLLVTAGVMSKVVAAFTAFNADVVATTLVVVMGLVMAHGLHRGKEEAHVWNQTA